MASTRKRSARAAVSASSDAETAKPVVTLIGFDIERVAQVLVELALEAEEEEARKRADKRRTRVRGS